MPVEIKEMVIKATVEETASLSKEALSFGLEKIQHLGSKPEIDLEMIIEECVEQVLKILEQQKAR